MLQQTLNTQQWPALSAECCSDTSFLIQTSCLSPHPAPGSRLALLGQISAPTECRFLQGSPLLKLENTLYLEQYDSLSYSEFCPQVIYVEVKGFSFIGIPAPCAAHVAAGAARERAPAGLRVLCRELVGNMRQPLQVTWGMPAPRHGGQSAELSGVQTLESWSIGDNSNHFCVGWRIAKISPASKLGYVTQHMFAYIDPSIYSHNNIITHNVWLSVLTLIQNTRRKGVVWLSY